MNDIQLERVDSVCEQRGGRITRLYGDIDAGTWTPPLKIGRNSFWPKHETQALLRARVAGADDEQLRVLVRLLLQQRKALMPKFEALSGTAA